MAILTLKTKQEVLIKPETNFSDTVYLDMITWTRFDTGYEACVQYYWLETIGDRQDEDGNDLPDLIVRHDIRSLGNATLVDFATANALATAINPDGDDYVSNETEYLIGGTFAVVGQQGYWGLTSADWELVVEAEEEVEE